MISTKERNNKIRKWLKENGKKGIVLSGRPYHLDPEINHGIPEAETAGHGDQLLQGEKRVRLRNKGKTGSDIRDTGMLSP